MKRTFLILVLVVFMSIFSGCSLIYKGEYLTANFEGKSTTVNRADWVTDANEPTFGELRPPLKKVALDTDRKISFIVYPIIVKERVLSIGPAFLPIVPVFKRWQDPPSEYSNKMRLLFEGVQGSVEGLEIAINGKPLLIHMVDNKDGTVLVFSDVLENIAGNFFTQVKLGSYSRSFFFEQEKTFCFVPFTSFN